MKNFVHFHLHGNVLAFGLQFRARIPLNLTIQNIFDRTNGTNVADVAITIYRRRAEETKRISCLEQ